ncbi:MAG: hypothetical protein K8S98_01755 [Planctomycetes bacterium]|nr:hypothetical protein [Planctomycetota bacterium]
MSRSNRGRRFWSQVALFGVVASLASTSHAQTYKLDDGTPGAALSYAFPEDFCWFDVLHAQGTVTLTSIEGIFGDVPDGHAISFCVWRDLGQAGDPSQGLLLTRVDTVVKNGGKQLLTQYAIPPTQVTGSFFVGALVTTDGSLSMATLDPHTNLPGLSWFATGYGPGTFDPSFTGSWTWWAPQTVGFKGVWMLRANGANGPTPEARCIAKTNSQGCVPTLTFAGTPSASSGSGFQVTSANVLGHKPGMFLYSLGGLQQTPFAGGFLCIRPPFKRTPVTSSGGSAGANCTGALALDFNAFVASGANPALIAGVTVDGQFWSRDAGFAAPNNVALSQAAHFGIGP